MKRLFEKESHATPPTDHPHHHHEPTYGLAIAGGLGLVLVAVLVVIALLLARSPEAPISVREQAKQVTLKQDAAKQEAAKQEQARLAKVAAAKSEQAKKDLADRAEFKKECDGVGGKQLTKLLSCTVFFEEPTAKPVAKRPHRRHNHWR